MPPLAPIVSTFIRVHLTKERELSPNTIDTYSHGLKLFFNFTAQKLKKTPSDLFVEDLHADQVLEFLACIESQRQVCASTHNSRLAAIKTFMRYVEFKEPSLYELTRKVANLPLKKHDQKLIRHLTMDEIEPIPSVPDLSTRLGIRDRAMIHLCFAAALRVSELVELPLKNLSLTQGSGSIFMEKNVESGAYHYGKMLQKAFALGLLSEERSPHQSILSMLMEPQ